MSDLVKFNRLDNADGYFETKDPSVVKLQDGGYMMYCSLGTSVTQEWVIGRFKAQHPGGPWQELEPCKIEGVSGPEMCAPAVVLEEKDGKPLFRMYVQTTCFSPNGIIAEATSEDGKTFRAAPPAMTMDRLPKGDIPVVGLYDVAISDVTRNGKPAECMAFSAYRDIGCGDIYLSFRDKGTTGWETPALALKQEDVPFHNKPGSPGFEWGLEGAKVVQLADDAFIMIGVCFLPGGERGTRQRVFMAAATNPAGPFTPMDTPIAPTAYTEGTGENGHPDTVDMDDKLGILYQERAGEGKPWHFRYTEMDKSTLILQVEAALAKTATSATSATPAPKPQR